MRGWCMIIIRIIFGLISWSLILNSDSNKIIPVFTWCWLWRWGTLFCWDKSSDQNLLLSSLLLPSEWLLSIKSDTDIKLSLEPLYHDDVMWCNAYPFNMAVLHSTIIISHEDYYHLSPLFLFDNSNVQIVAEAQNHGKVIHLIAIYSPQKLLWNSTRIQHDLTYFRTVTSCETKEEEDLSAIPSEGCTIKSVQDHDVDDDDGY